MSPVPFARWIAAALVLHSLSAAAEPIELDLPGALARAHRLAPGAIDARGRVAEADAKMVGARRWFTANPELDAGAGPRLISGSPIDLDARIEQDLEPGRRGPRLRVAHAEAGQARASAAATLRELDREVSAAFVDVLFADRAATLARHGEELAQRAATAADRRRAAGEITDLDANLARVALGCGRAAVQAALAQRAGAVSRLAELIGARPGDAITARGDLTALAVPAPDAIHAAGAARPDVRAWQAEREVAIAEQAQAVASGRPALALWASYRREDTDDVLMGGLRVTLPIWNHAQGELAASRARELHASDARDAALRAADRQLVDALAAYDAARQAVEVFARDVAPLLDGSERLLQQTVDAGQIAVSDYLVARQELLNGRREHLERLLAFARAAVELRYVAGGTP
jgi:outer membrane protein TolC